MVVDLPRRWRWAIGGACGAVLLLGLVIIGAARIPLRASNAAPVAAARLVAPESPIAAAERDVAAAPVAPSGATGAVDEVQVCGGAWVRTQPDGSIDPAEFDRAAQLPQQRKRLLAALRAHPGDLAQAAALLLAAPDAASPPTDALARLALGSSDARVYALAFKVCARSGGGEGACRMLSAAQWARMDPDNAAPWHFMFAAAAERGDRAAQDDALFRLASARRSASGYFDVVGAVLAVTPDDDDTALAAWAMVNAAAGVEAAVVVPGLQWLVQACRDPALRDANRAQLCTSLAGLMAERADNLLERMIGAAIGRQSGWPAERADRMRGEYNAYLTEALRPAAAQADALGCAAIRRDLDRARRHAMLGEAGALREWVGASGHSAQHFIALARAAAAAASAPVSVAGR